MSRVVLALLLAAFVVTVAMILAYRYFQRQEDRRHEERAWEHEERKELFDDEDL